MPEKLEYQIKAEKSPNLLDQINIVQDISEREIKKFAILTSMKKKTLIQKEL